MWSISLLKFFLVFAVTLRLFSELTVKETTASAAVLFVIQVEAIKKESYVTDSSVCDASVLFDSFA